MRTYNIYKHVTLRPFCINPYPAIEAWSVMNLKYIGFAMYGIETSKEKTIQT